MSDLDENQRNRRARELDLSDLNSFAAGFAATHMLRKVNSHRYQRLVVVLRDVSSVIWERVRQ